MDSLFSSTLETVAPLRLRKIKENSQTPWYNEHTRTLKRAARKMERSWKKTKLEVFRIAMFFKSHVSSICRGSRGLMVRESDLESKGCGFESQVRQGLLVGE